MKPHRFKIQVLMVLLSGIFLPAFSQQIEVTASKPDYNFGSTHVHKIIGHDPEHFYVIKYHSGQYYLEKLDRDLNLMLERPIKLFEGFKTYDLETACHFHNELYIFVSRRRFNDIILYFQKIDKSNLQPSTDLIELTTIPFMSGNWADFHFALSRHETKLLLACRTKLQWTKVQFNEYYVFGKDLELMWRRKDSFDFTGQGPRENKYVVDETGNVSILSLKKRESLLSLFSHYKNIYTIYCVSDNGRNFQEYPVTYRDKYIRGIKIIGGENGEVICAGLYSELFRYGVRGNFFFKINPVGGGIYDNSLHEFDDAMLARLAETKEPVIKDEELVSYVMTDMVLRENGRIICIAEQFFEQTYNTYNNLIVMCFDMTGNIYWSQVIEKRQDFNINVINDAEVLPVDYRDFVIETGTIDQYVDNYCSYALMAPLDRPDIIIFYNDNIKNLENPGENKNMIRPRKSYILAVVIDEFGNVVKQPVLKWKRKALFPEPLRYYDTLFNTIVIPAFKGNKYNYYKITAGF